jgi:hypothetical protein
VERLVAWPARNQERETNRQSGFTIAHPLAFGRSGTVFTAAFYDDVTAGDGGARW